MVQTIVDASGLPAVLAMDGRPAFPAELAETEFRALRSAALARRETELAEGRPAPRPVVLRDLGGHPMVNVADPLAIAWQAGLDARVTALSADIERAMLASREPVLVDIEHLAAGDGG